MNIYFYFENILDLDDVIALQASFSAPNYHFREQGPGHSERNNPTFTRGALGHLLVSAPEWARLATFNQLNDEQFAWVLAKMTFTDDQDELALFSQINSTVRLAQVLAAMPVGYEAVTHPDNWAPYIKPGDLEILKALIPHLPSRVVGDLVAGFATWAGHRWPSRELLNHVMSVYQLRPYALANRIANEAIEYQLDIPTWYLHRLIYLVPGMVPALARLSGPEPVRAYKIVSRALGPNRAQGLTLLDNPGASLGSVLRALATIERSDALRPHSA